MKLLNRVLSVLLGLALVVLGVVVPVEVVHAALNRSGHLLVPYGPVADFLREHAWSSAPVLAILAAAAVVGLLLVLAQLKPRRPGLLAMDTDDDSVTVGIARRSLGRALGAAASDVDGVTEARGRLRRSRATVVAVSPLRDVSGLEERVRDRVQGSLDDLRLVTPPALKVRLRQEERS